MMNALILSDNKDFKATLKEKLTNYYTLISEYEHKEISFLTVDLTEFALIDFKSWKSAKEHIVDFLFDKLKTFLPVIKRHVWGSIIVLLPDSENIFLNIAVSAAEGMLKSIACELAPENVILNVIKIKGFDPEKTAELAKFFSDSRAYLTAQVLCADLTRIPDKLNIQTVSDPVALVTGSGQGIGLAISRGLSNLGYRVCANDIKFSDEVLSEIEEKNWLNAHGDISIKENTDDMISNIRNRYGRLDVLVANAAYMNMTPFADVNINDFEKHLSVNVEGHLNILQQAVELMKKQRYGRIILFSSMFGVEGWKNASAYSATKRAMIGACKALSKKLEKYNISVCAIAPGIIDTPQLQADADDFGVTREEMIKIYEKDIPLGRAGKPEDVAYLASFLAGENALALSGSVIQTNGGESRSSF